MKKKESAAVLKDVLFEIGTEELPATNLADIFESAASQGAENPLETKLKQALEAGRLTFKECRVWATPRRLVFWVAGAAPSQAPKENLIKLLARQEAYGADGRPTEKLLVILKHRNFSPDDLTTSDLNGKEFVFIRKDEPVRKSASVLPEIFEALVKSLSFPKTMRWDESGLYFPRPIRSALCLYGAEPVRFRLGSVRTAAETWIFSKAKRVRHAVKDVESYFQTLRKNGVILDPAERKKAVEEILSRLARQAGGRLYEDPFLLNEVNFLVERPEGLAASFDGEFLKLPLEVLTVSMARKQRVFGLLDKDGRAMPKFLAILDGAAGDREKKIIGRNIESILHAKLQDSLFFYKEDVKVPLEKKRVELKDLIFLKGAGSMLEKSERLFHLSRKGIDFGVPLPVDQKNALTRAAFLSKSDLLTHMVGEFPELQGVIGKYYAAENGESAETAQAIGEQYLPRTVQDRLPASLAGGILSMLDKVDLVVACFLLGLEPSSSLDPYGLRRSGAAVIKIVRDKKLRFSLSGLVRTVASLQKIEKPKYPEAELLKKLCDETGFFWDRFRAVVVGEIGGDIVDAVTATRHDDFLEVYERAKALSRIARDGGDFLKAHKVVERTHNILKGNKEGLPAKPDRALFAESLEHAVMEKLERHEAGIVQAKQQGDLSRATSLYAEAFFDILNEFFDKVFINAEDVRVRKNRLSLLKAIKDLYTSDIADLSKIRLAETF